MTWVNAVVQGVLLGGLFALFATGLSLAFGVMRFVNLAHGDLAVLAAFLAVSTTAAFDVNPFVTLLLIVPGFAVGGYVLQRLVFNRVMGADPLPSILVDLRARGRHPERVCSSTTAPTPEAWTWGRSRSVAPGSPTTSPSDGSPCSRWSWRWSCSPACSCCSPVRTAGRAFRATADDAATARLMGIDDRRVYARIMAIAFATVALAGVFLGIRQTFGPADGPAILLFGFESVVIGGMGSLWGTLVGGVILGVAQTVGNQVDVRYDVLSGTLYGHLIFLAVLAFRPQGLLGRRGRA